MKRIKKILAGLLVIAVLCCMPALGAGASKPVDLSEEDREHLNEFFGLILHHAYPLGLYDVKDIPACNDNVLLFSVWQAIQDGVETYYSWGNEENSDDFGLTDRAGTDRFSGPVYYVSRDKVNSMIYRYFAITNIDHRSVNAFLYENRLYYWPPANGGTYIVPNVIEMRDNLNDTFSVKIELHNYGWAADGNDEYEVQYAIAVVQESEYNDLPTYQLLYWNPGASQNDPLVARRAPSYKGDTIRVYVNGVIVEFDQIPLLESGRTLVPLRAIFEALGAEVGWEDSTQTVTAVRGDIQLTLQIGSDIMLRNGVQIKLDVPARLVNSRTLIPLRAVAEAFGCDVTWVDDTWVVLITE